MPSHFRGATPVARPGIGLRSRLAWTAAALLLLASPILPLDAPLGPTEAEAQMEAPAGEGYLLGQPRLTISARAGFSLAMAQSDFHDFVQEELTLDRGDFDGGLWGLDAAIRLTDRLDLVAGFARATSAESSEYRDYVEPVNGQELPIEQRTRIEQTPVTAGLRIYPARRGRTIGQFVWIPEQVRPYVGGAVGLVHHRLVQDGDWVDFETLDIFTERFESEGWDRTLHLLGGVEVGLGTRFALNAEGRYQHAEVELGRQFEGFEPLDLSGFQLTAGVSVQF